jgi:hypothetical protein
VPQTVHPSPPFQTPSWRDLRERGRRERQRPLEAQRFGCHVGRQQGERNLGYVALFPAQTRPEGRVDHGVYGLERRERSRRLLGHRRRGGGFAQMARKVVLQPLRDFTSG